MITNNTPATIRIIDVLSIALSFHWKKYFMPFPIIVEPERAIPCFGDESPGTHNCRAGQRQLPDFCSAAEPKAQTKLVNPRATALDENNQNDRKYYTGYNPDNCGTVHFHSSLPQGLKNVLKDSIIKITAGPRVTRNSAGKMKNTSGKTNLTEVFAAISSTACIRWVLRVSE
jgi:hypothetical protein